MIKLFNYGMDNKRVVLILSNTLFYIIFHHFIRNFTRKKTLHHNHKSHDCFPSISQVWIRHLDYWNIRKLTDKTTQIPS